jgi:hypothetical protein
MQEFKIPSVLQALGRVGIQFVAMGLAGSITPLLLYTKPYVLDAPTNLRVLV